MLQEPTSTPRNALPTEQHLSVTKPDNQQSTLGTFVNLCKRKILALVDLPLRYLFGRDVFISYSRSDARNYVPKLATTLRSEIPGLSLYLDRWVAPPSGELPGSMRRHLRWSSLLVVIASENALKSRFVKEEIRRFAETGRQIIPISVDGEWEKIDWSQDPWRDVRGAAPEREDGSNVENGTPSGAVIDRIKNSTLFTRQDQRLRRAVHGTVMGILILIVGAIGLSSLIIRSARAEANDRIVAAQDREREANVKADAAETRATKADEKAVKAEERARVADDKTLRAEKRATDADIKAGQSEARAKKAAEAEAEAIKRRDEAQQMERRASLVAQARTALSTGYPLSGYTLARDSLKLNDLPDARLLVAEAYNRGLPLELNYFSGVQGLAASTTQGTKIAAIGVTPEEKSYNNHLKLWDLDTGTNRDVGGYRFYSVQFAPDGQSLFAVALTKYVPGEGEGMDRKIDMEVDLIKYDLSLKELAKIPFNLGDWDVREIQDIRVDKTGRRLVLAGYAAQAPMRNLSNPSPFHLRSWMDLNNLTIKSSIDEQNELSSYTKYRGRVVLGDGNNIIVDGTDEVYSIDMTNGERKQIGKHTAEVTDLAVSPSGATIAAAGGDKLSVFTRSGNDWQREVVDFAGGADGEFVAFLGERRIAVTRQDFSVTIVSLDKPKEIVLDGKTEWRSARLTNLTGHTAKIQLIKVSPDGRWLATAGEDKTIRLWGLQEDERLVFQGSQRGVTQLEFGGTSKQLFVAGLDGTVRAYNISSEHRFSLPVHPAGTKQEFTVVDQKWDEGGGLTRSILRQDWGFVRTLKWSRDYQYLYATTYDGVKTVWDKNYKPVEGVKANEVIASIEQEAARPGGVTGQLEVTPDKRLILHHIGTTVEQVTPTPEPKPADEDKDNDEDEDGPAGKDKDKSKTPNPIFSFDGKKFIQLSYYDGSVYIWDGINTLPVRLEKIYGDFHRGDLGDYDSHKWVKFSRGGTYFAFPFDSDGPAICVIDVKAGKAHVFKGDLFPQVFDISDDGDLIAAGRTGKIFMHSVIENKTWLLEKYGQHSRYVTSVAFSPDGKWIASGSRDRTVRLWSRTGRDYIDFPLLNPVEEVVFSPNGKELLVAAGLGVHAWYVPTGTLDELAADYTPPSTQSDRESPNSNMTPETQQNSTVPAFLSYRPNTAPSRAVIEEALGRRVELNDRRMAELVDRLASAETKGEDRTLAALELSLYGPRALTFVPRICRALKQVDGDDRRPDPNVVALLKLIGPGAERPFLDTFASTSDEELKTRMALAISSLYPTSTRAVTALRAALRNSNVNVRIASALSLARTTKDKAAIPYLAEAMCVEPGFDEAAELLVSYGRDAVPALIDTFDVLAESNYPDASKLTRGSLVKIGKDALPMLLDALKEKRGEALSDVIFTLRDMPPESGDIVKPLIELLKEEKKNNYRDRYAVSAAVYVLGSRGRAAREAIPYMMDVFLNGGDGADIDVSLALEKMGPEALPYLMKALPVTQNFTKSLVARTIGKCGPAAKDAVPLLTQALWSGDQWTPGDAAEALGNIGPDASAAVPDLIKLLDVETRDYIRRDIITALGKIGANPSLTVPALVKAIEVEVQGIPERVFLVTDASLRMLESEGVPSDIVQGLESVRPGPEFPWGEERLMGKLSQLIPRERWAQYKDVILKHTEYKDPRTCDDPILSRQQAAYEALGKFGVNAADVAPQIEQIKQRFPQCTDIRKYADDALKLIRKTPEIKD